MNTQTSKYTNKDNESQELQFSQVEYLSTYANIGAATCLLEDPAGHAVSEAVRINALWSEKVSLSSQAG